jgi:hypothetical protein
MQNPIIKIIVFCLESIAGNISLMEATWQREEEEETYHN